MSQTNIELENCLAQGNGAATRGFYLSHLNADECNLSNCISLGNVTAGYEIVAGCSYVSVADCSSGLGDGERVDNGTNISWRNYIYKDSTTNNIPQFGGNIWYVNKNNGNDTYSGTSPQAAFETIGQAIGVLTSGDAINVMAGTYTEVGLNLNVANCEM